MFIAVLNVFSRIYCVSYVVYYNLNSNRQRETSLALDATSFAGSSTIIHYFLSGTHSYIDATKKLANMKKRLRFQMPHVPLKVRRGEEDKEDPQDKLFERFQAPATTTEDDDDDSTDSYSYRSSLASDDIVECTEAGMNRHLYKRI